MNTPHKSTPAAFSLRYRPRALQWGLLLAASLAFIVPFELVHLPAALLLGAMAAAILVSALEGKPTPPQWTYVIAQGLIGCLVARSIGPGILLTMAQHWPVFLAGVVVVLIFSTTLGALLARWKVLPGTAAVWGSAPGAATVMVLMAGCYAVVGWIIGLRFTREIVVYAARMLPRITTSILMLIIVCGGLAWVLHLALGTDMLTAYLATSPGGADSIAIIAASSIRFTRPRRKARASA